MDKYKVITKDSNYVASCTPTSPLLHLRFETEYFDRLIFVAQSIHGFFFVSLLNCRCLREYSSNLFDDNLYVEACRYFVSKVFSRQPDNTCVFNYFFSFLFTTEINFFKATGMIT
jgi:hypothetical protein